MNEDDMSAPPCQELQVLNLFDDKLIKSIDGATEIYDPIFSGIRIYGTPEYPVFVAADVQKALKITNLHYRGNDGVFEWVEDKLKIRVITPTGAREVIAFTEQGLYYAVWLSKTDAAKQFKRFMTCVMKRLRMTGSVTMDQAVEDLKIENVRLEKTLKAYNIQMEAEHRELMHYKAEHDTLVISRHDLGDELYKAKKTIEYAKVADEGTMKERYIRAMQRTGKPIYVMLSEPPKEHKESHTYELSDYSEGDIDILDPSDSYIFSFGISAHKHKVTMQKVYVHKTVKIEDLQKELMRYRLEKNDRSGDQTGYYTNMYEISLDGIDNAIDEINRRDEEAKNQDD